MLMFKDKKENSTAIQNLPKRLAVIVAGSVLAAYGITLALYAGFGGATLAVLWQGISGTFHISIGMASFIVALGMILFAVIYDRKQIHIGTVLYQIVYSVCVDLFANLHVYSRFAWLNTFALAEKNHWQVRIVRMILDVLVVVAGVLLGGKFGVCTVITVLVSGPIIQYVNNKAKQLLKL